MKKVRFESPHKLSIPIMDERECHSPRPYIEKQAPTSSYAPCFQYQRILPYSADPVERYECSDSSPYPTANKTKLPGIGHKTSNWRPCNDLDLSMLDASGHEPRKLICKPNVCAVVKPTYETPMMLLNQNTLETHPPNILHKDNNFFIRRGNLDKYHFDKNPLQTQLNKLRLDKENNPLVKKVEIMRSGVANSQAPLTLEQTSNFVAPVTFDNHECSCHHCVKAIQIHNKKPMLEVQNPFHNNQNNIKCHCVPPPKPCFHCNQTQQCPKIHQCGQNAAPQTYNTVEKKTMAIEKYEQSKCTDVEKQSNVREKREPTVADLLKIIKLQNEQLQLLQEKVDKFISMGNNTPNVQNRNVQSLPAQNYVNEVALQTLGSEEHKISIGVMTSFEMVRTSTVINKEIVKQTNENTQIQCNRSQISIKEVVSKSQPVNLNFLDGIIPVGKNTIEVQSSSTDTDNEVTLKDLTLQQLERINDEKTLNELSLYNVQVDNATTPLMSPEQSLYLDVRDYSDSDSGSDDQSNVGWTYYNKVMTHVNGMLQDSDMPSSASALYRNTRQQCLQMQIDKTNVSVTKRVKFGDDPLGIHQPHIYATTDTSLKMNQLAAKYLKGPVVQQPATKSRPIDMSFATKNYMERHKLLQGSSRSPIEGDMPRFLDITALKQQPKFL